MFKMNKLAVLFGALMSLSLVSAMAQPVIVSADIERAIALSKAGKNMNEQVEKMTKSVQGEVEKVQKSLQKEADKLEEQKNLMASDALQVKREELRLKQITKQQEISAEARSIQAGAQNALKEIAEIAVDELKTLAEEKKADIVLRREATYIVSPTSDLTDELIKRIDKKITSVKVTPATPKQN